MDRLTIHDLMTHLFQVGAGSGGMAVLDLLARDERIDRVTLIEPDVFKPHNVVRHLFGPERVGQLKAELAAEWLRRIRPELRVEILPVDLLAAEHQDRLHEVVAGCDLGVCAVDNEPAKFRFDALMRHHTKRWTLGEVLSGGIGGWLHRFVPGGPCYGCVASSLRREIQTDMSPPPDYSDPNAVIAETSVPADKASIAVIAGLHAMVTLELLEETSPESDFTSLLFALRRVPDVFEQAYRLHRFPIKRAADCLICGPAGGTTNGPTAGEDLDVALDEALSRLGNE